MPDLLIRNVPHDLHARLKAAATEHRRSVTQETIATLELGLRNGGTVPAPPRLPEPIKMRRPTTMEETLRFIDDGLERRGMPDNP
ncbi:MAG: plasmid stability protein [Verrucomicrobiota bacterium]